MWSERSYRYYKSCISPSKLFRSLPLTAAVAVLAFGNPLFVQGAHADGGGIPQAKCTNGVPDVPTSKEDYECIDEGFRLFTKETFEGNGRTCATCHIPEENYNIFPSTIKKLSKKEKKLVFAPHVPGLENKDLIKSHALFNISGGPDSDASDPSTFDHGTHTGVIFRSTMTVAATDITKDNFFNPGTPLFPAKCNVGVAAQLPQFGWAGDGSPGTPVDDIDCRTHHGNEDVNANGSLRSFANGAIAQHNPKSLLRISKNKACDLDPDSGLNWCGKEYDFRFATNDELDALEAFQKWLGRRTLNDGEVLANQGGSPQNSELNINLLNFADNRVNMGRDHYFAGPRNGPGGVQDPNFGAGCDACHANGGANTRFPPGPPTVGRNVNLNTDVELAADDIGQAVVGADLPHDEGGFILPLPGQPVTLEGFNVQSVIEAALKKGFFHNHRETDLEEAIRFYGRSDFIDNGPGIFTSLEDMEAGGGAVTFPDKNGVDHVGAFLRSLTAYYKLRDCGRLIEESIDRMHKGHDPKLASFHCELNLKDVKRVLSQSKLPKVYPVVVADSNKVRRQLKSAVNYWNIPKMKKVLAKVNNMKDSIATHGVTEVAAAE